MLSRNQIIIIAAIGFVVLFFVLIFLGIIPGLGLKKQGGGGGGGGQQLLQLNFWGVEDENAFKPIIDNYEKNGVKVNYIRFSEDNYEKNLIDALASGKGPDILAFHNTWLPKHSGKIVPVSTASFSMVQLKNLFPQVVEKDFAADGRIYALPLYIDTLAFIYNRDFFDSRGVAVVPKSWAEFQNVIPALRENDALGRISKAAAAIGGSGKSVDKAGDLLSLIMLQFGVEMNVENSFDADFYRDKKSISALDFYLQFSDSGSQSYSWSDSLRYSLDNFSGGGTAAIFNYASAIPLIKAKNPFLNLEVAPMLQFSKDSVNYADYWGMAVSSQSKQQAAAWNFIISTAANSAVAEQYLQASKRPPALRPLIQKYFNDPDLGVFASQTLTAKSWKQKDNAAVRKIFSNMIESILNGGIGADRALQQAENEMNGL
ncbi:extracellular solute-binding protein [Candidatus Wolfebacteria bacterium]|nr:extracellular solute-binding protein [Candidatus Wolfebacteria bacterium]